MSRADTPIENKRLQPLLDEARRANALLLQRLSALEEQNDSLKYQLATLDQKNRLLNHNIEQLRHLHFGQRKESRPSTRMPSVKDKAAKKHREENPEQAAKETQDKRRKSRSKKLELEEITARIPVNTEQEKCTYPGCSGLFRDLGPGEQSSGYEYVPPHFIRKSYIRDRRICSCGQTIITAPAPERVADNVTYGPGLHAQVVVSKTMDSLPLYRQEKIFKRHGIPVSDSTLGEMFHRCAHLLEPIYQRLLASIRDEKYVNADETPIQVQAPGKTKRSYMWTFIADHKVIYVYDSGRSSEVPLRVLGDSSGFLQVDGYTGYNAVCVPNRRTRVGCHAHNRRYFFNIRDVDAEAWRYVAEDVYEKLYKIEKEAKRKKIIGKPQHLAMRQSRSKPIMDKFKRWLNEKRSIHPPQHPLSKAIQYAENNWESLTVFLDDANVCLDNNVSESHLRIIAKGRDNFLFVGNAAAGKNLAILQTLTSCCATAGVNPYDYLRDVLIRIQHHPAKRIDELLPHRWKDLDALTGDDDPR